MKKEFVLFLQLIALNCAVGLVIPRPKPTVPIVLWHEIGDSCDFMYGMKTIQQMLENQLWELYVKCIRLGDGFKADVMNSYFKDANDQVREVCEELQKDEMLSDGFNAIGFGQGALFLRALVQRCPDLHVFNLISLGGPHQGIYGVPKCTSAQYSLCDYSFRVLNYAAYTKDVQNHIVQAQYWHDPLQEDVYKQSSTFLADINNERNVNKTYIKNLGRLRNLVLVKFVNETVIKPVETEWFGFYSPGQAVQTEKLEDSAIYKEDRLGLADLQNSGRLHFLAVELFDYTEEWFLDNIIKRFLK
ncbi:palmitoyl-protein thioesterase 1 [Copidosoma floridanum]|uniref:palmitoyl-protein thioesterase 1 n=1 Tax=Copidosoma floridanum TaxID=29053 RepID=UPI0006C974EA|nr:palmitoyl-protein thioesterase 1 [Copidosoma floridanum]